MHRKIASIFAILIFAVISTKLTQANVKGLLYLEYYQLILHEAFSPVYWNLIMQEKQNITNFNVHVNTVKRIFASKTCFLNVKMFRWETIASEKLKFRVQKSDLCTAKTSRKGYLKLEETGGILFYKCIFNSPKYIGFCGLWK